MKRIARGASALLVGLGVIACAELGALRYTLEINESRAEPIRSRVVFAGREWFGATVQSYVGLTAAVPESADVYWYRMDDPIEYHATVQVRKSMPPQFRSGDSIVIEFQEDQRVAVGFEVTLSDVSRRVIYHPLSQEELERQRQDDELFRAFRVHDTERLRKALQSGADPYQTWRPSSQQHPYGDAIDRGWLDILEVFIAAGFAPREENGFSSLLSPVTKGRPAVVKALLNAGANPNYVGPLCPRPQTRDLVWGCKGSDYPIIYSAIYHGELEVVRMLIEHGAVVDRQLKDGSRIVDWIREHASPEMRKVVERAVHSRKQPETSPAP